MQAWAAETSPGANTRPSCTTRNSMFEEWCNAKIAGARDRIYGDMMGLTRFTILLKKMADDRVIDYRKAHK